ncbi:MAG: lysostaphin resistance A-like protein [Lachnospiraceae bacterium]
MKKLQEFARKHTIWYCVIVEIVALGCVMLSGTLITVLFSNDSVDYYVLYLLQEIVAIGVNLFLLYVSGLFSVLHHRGAGFGKGILIGLYMLITAIYAGFGMVVLYMEEVQKNDGMIACRSWYLILAYVLCMMAIGISEEILFRGIIATACLRKFGMNRAGIWKSVVLSGVLFGCAHLTNLLGCEPSGVLVQVVIASGMGMFFSAIYYRSGCIWVTIFLHSLQDFCAGIVGGFFVEQGNIADSISGYGLQNLPAIILYIAVVLFLLRRKKMEEVKENMGDLLEM